MIVRVCEIPVSNQDFFSCEFKRDLMGINLEPGDPIKGRLDGKVVIALDVMKPHPLLSCLFQRGKELGIGLIELRFIP
jgi:hypothetical protein